MGKDLQSAYEDCAVPARLPQDPARLTPFGKG